MPGIATDEIRRIHEAMGDKYPMPDLSSPLFVVQEEFRNGHLIGAGAVKAVGEAFLWLDPHTSTRKRAEAVIELSSRCALKAQEIGLEEVSAWIPIDIEPDFGRILIRRGWVKSPWPCYTRILG